MRALLPLLVALAACSPDIASGSYACGPEQSCPPNQACDGAENVCVSPGLVTPFACDPDVVREPDDTAPQGFQLDELACISPPVIVDGCLAAGDAKDWLVFSAASGCTALQVEARVTFPVAFEPVGLELWDLDGNAQLGADEDCPPSTASGAGEDVRCLVVPVTPGGNYGLAVRPAGGGDCGGTCNYNRYQVTVQLDTPG